MRATAEASSALAPHKPTSCQPKESGLSDQPPALWQWSSQFIAALTSAMSAQMPDQVTKAAALSTRARWSAPRFVPVVCELMSTP